jgi:hypothetical protein
MSLTIYEFNKKRYINLVRQYGGVNDEKNDVTVMDSNERQRILAEYTILEEELKKTEKELNDQNAKYYIAHETWAKKKKENDIMKGIVNNRPTGVISKITDAITKKSEKEKKQLAQHDKELASLEQKYRTELNSLHAIKDTYGKLKKRWKRNN